MGQDVIFHDCLIDEDVLELAHHNVERFFVGRHIGAHTWPQQQINAVNVVKAQKGHCMVCLKSSNPSNFWACGRRN